MEEKEERGREEEDDGEQSADSKRRQEDYKPAFYQLFFTHTYSSTFLCLLPVRHAIGKKRALRSTVNPGH